VRGFGISRKTGYKIFNRYRQSGLEALGDRSRRPVRYANQLPPQIEANLKASMGLDKPLHEQYFAYVGKVVTGDLGPSLRNKDKTVAELITEWVDAWRTKDIERYRACYADDFYAQKMNLHAWIRHKASLNKMYKRIEVSIEDLEISEEQDRSTATFLQRYSSNRLDSVGIKRLNLRRVDGLWKIYRETWHKI